MIKLTVIALCFVIDIIIVESTRQPTIEEAVKNDPDLSQFYSLLESNQFANFTISYRQATLFAPNNEAFQRFVETPDENLVLYHLTHLATNLQNLEYSLASAYDGNPPLWITRRRDALHDDIYVNNARVIAAKTIQSENRNGKRQVLHVIDEVLTPIQSLPSTSSPLYNPNADQFLERSDELAIGTHRLRSFRQKVHQLGKREIFQAEGRHTFFIPVEDGFKQSLRPNLIDAKVIDGHVVPNRVLFTKATPEDKPYETMAFDDNIKVTVSFGSSVVGRDKVYYVKSNTIVGDVKHTNGVVMAEIVKANIPVRNGVVHLIQRPLMVVDSSVTQFLEDNQNGPLFKFYEVIMDLGGDFFRHLQMMKDVTILAPSNEAWRDPNINNFIRNKQKAMEILYQHLIYDRLPIEKILQNDAHQIHRVPSAVDKRYLYFNVMRDINNVTVTVEGGGVNATIIQPNLAATNGYVHIIDRVLGVPHASIFDKIRTDPLLNISYNLGKRRLFNHQLDDKAYRFTYFVPRDTAWKKFENEYPSMYKKLFMDEFSSTVKQILERHLVKADRHFTMSDMKLLANETHAIVLPSVRDTLRLRVKETDKNFFIEWNGRWIHVYKADVECLNGVVHVIDEPLVRESDIKVAVDDSTSLSHSIYLIYMAICTIIMHYYY